MRLTTTIVKFPEIRLRTRDGHKLRGFFGNLFEEHSELLHNHYADGSGRYKYPLVQYKVVNRLPHLVGIAEGADLLIELFLKIKFLDIDGQHYAINAKNITNKTIEIGDFTTLKRYRFKTLWYCLNQRNFKRYISLEKTDEKDAFLNRLLQNNILSFYKGIGYRVEERIMATSELQAKKTQFKNQNMIAFSGHFVSNAVLPDFAGIGRSVSRGFGVVQSKG